LLIKIQCVQGYTQLLNARLLIQYQILNFTEFHHLGFQIILHFFFFPFFAPGAGAGEGERIAYTYMHGKSKMIVLLPSQKAKTTITLSILPCAYEES